MRAVIAGAGIGDDVRAHAALGGDSGIRRPDGRWLARSRLGPAEPSDGEHCAECALPREMSLSRAPVPEMERAAILRGGLVGGSGCV
jgi:hypothetical protein